MHTEQIGKDLFLVDLQTGGFKNLIASYVLKGEKTLIVETGPTSSIPNLLSGLKELQVEPASVAYVALTHVHIDHGGGVGTLMRNLPNAKVIVHRKGAPHLQDPTKLWVASKQTLGPVANIFGEPQAVPQERIVVASEGETFDLGGGVTLKTLETSGHAAHNLSFYEPRNGGVFPGDSAGAYLAMFDTVFPTTPPPFRPDIALVSLDKLISLNPQFVYYSHFGKASDAVGRLRGYQVQIKRWLNIVQEAVKQGESADAIREKVLAQDETVREVVPLLKANPIHRKTLIENSVQGFINFAQNPPI
jgi:glyoxylase-like metal-dependent hydrolase (beta-lactamase superfamily II)